MTSKSGFVVLALLLAPMLSLHGCGGSSGTPDPAPAPPAPPPEPPAAPAVTITPSSVSATSIEGAPTSFQVTLALSEQAAAETDHVEFEDVGGAAGVGGYVGSFQVLAGSTLRNLTVQFNIGEPPQGRFGGLLRFYLCREINCQTTVSGSPFSVSYVVIVGPPPPPLVTPGSLNLTTEANDSAAVDLTVTVTTRQASVGLKVGIEDTEGRFNTLVEQSKVTGEVATYSVLVRTIPVAVPGTYSGTATVFLCSFSPCALIDAVPGSQVSLPYSLVVTPEVLLEAVPSLTGLPEWETFQGTSAHTGHVPVTLDVAAFASRWTWMPPDNTYWMDPVVTGSGKVVVGRTNLSGTVSSLFAIEESSGIAAWQFDFEDPDTIYRPDPPAVWGGRVFLSRVVPDYPNGIARTMQSFDLGSGDRLFSTRTPSQWQEYQAPTITGGLVYAGGGQYGGLNAFNGKTGVHRWFVREEECESSTPAVDENYVYSYVGDTLTVLHRVTGELHSTTQEISVVCGPGGSAPVLPGDGSVVVMAPGIRQEDSLFRYDMTTATRTWQVTGSFQGNPVVANGMVYVVNTLSNQLEARSLETGAPMWVWNLPEPAPNRASSNMIVTDNMIFVATASGTYAIDLNTHAAVWNTTLTGSLALSSNLVLYIATTGYVSPSSLPPAMRSPGRIDAFDLAAAP